MKLYFLLFFFTILWLSSFSQIDNTYTSIAIPAIKSDKDSIDTKAVLPAKPLNDKINLPSYKAPQVSNNLNFPKKEFSMFPQEQFGNPGELYVKQINKNIADVKLSPEEIERRNGSTTDQFLGDFKSGAKFVNVVYRDHGYTDGDIIQVLVNDDIVHARVYLTGGYKGFKLDLQKGFNKIDFLALNQGESGPNTAEFQVVDDAGNLVSHNQWNLATGVKATIIIVKE
jgi:hypothetical protein